MKKIIGFLCYLLLISRFNFVSIIRVSSFKFFPMFCRVLSNFNKKNTATNIGKPTVLMKFNISIKKVRN